MKNYSLSIWLLVRRGIFLSLCLAIPAGTVSANVLKLIIPAVLIKKYWRVPQLIESDDAGNAQYPQVAFDSSGNAIAVWQQYDGTRFNIWANRYTASGNWGTAQLIETDDADCFSNRSVVHHAFWASSSACICSVV